MTRLRCLTFVLLLCLTMSEVLSSDPLTYTINTKKWSHVLDDHFISVTINPTDLLQGKAFGLGMNSTIAILKGLSPAYIRIGSADTAKYTFKRSRYPSDVARTEDEFIITESHWTILNDVARSAGLDIIVCLNAAHRTGSSKKWDTRNSLELISFSDSQGYNLTFQLGYEVQRSLGISGHQYGKDLNRLRTILNAFPRYQHSKLIGPDIRVLQRKEDVEFITEALLEAGPTLDAVTWHPRWPQPSKMKVSDVSELGYEFPLDYIEWDRSQLNRILQRSILKNPIWIGEPKTESTGTFAEGLLWARRLVLAAKLGIEVVMKQPSLMDISHPKPEYWIAFLHKRLLSKSVLETRAANNQTEVAVITHCTNPLFWSEKQNKAVDGAITVYAVNMGGKEQKVHVKGTWSGKSQIMLQYLLTSGSDPDSVFSQMTYLNGEPLMMTDDGNLPDIIPRVRRVERGVIFKLPPYSAGFWVVPEARVKICQMQPQPVSPSNFENLSTGTMLKSREKNLPNVRNLNQLIVDKLKNPISESDEENYDDGVLSDDSSEGDFTRESSESPRLRSSRRVRQITVEDIGQELKEKIREIREMLENKESYSQSKGLLSSEALRAAEEKITSLTDELGTATRMTDQHEEFGRFLHHAGLNQDFGALMMNEGRGGLQGLRRSTTKNQWSPLPKASTAYDPLDPRIRRFRRSLSYPEDDYEEESTESFSSEEEDDTATRPYRKSDHRKRLSRLHEDSDESGDHSNYPGSPALKGLEEKYKSFISYRIQDGKKKLGDLRRQKKKEETEEPRKPGGRKGNNLENDLQEEILMKEVEVLQKTEEAMANLIKNHKKRQQTIEEIILHEISDIKEDRLTALEDMRSNKGGNTENSEELQEIPGQTEIPRKIRRSVLGVLHKTTIPRVNPVVKRSIGQVDSSLNGLPENSMEEKKVKVIKRSLDSSYDRSFKRKKSRMANRDDDDSSVERSSRRLRKTRSERLERMKNFIQSRERLRDRNIFRRKSHRSSRKHKADESDEDSHEVLSTFGPEFLDNSEDRVIKEIQKEILKKPERRISDGEAKESELQGTSNREQADKQIKKDENKNESNNGSDDKSNSNTGGGNVKKSNEDNNKSKSNSNGSSNGNSSNSNKSSTDDRSNSESQNSRPRSEGKRPNAQESSTNSKVSAKKTKNEEQPEYVPLKIDKNRGLNVLKRISNLVESINTREKSRPRKPSMDVEDLSEEFYGDAISKLTKRRHRRSHHRENEDEEDNAEGASEGNDFSEVETTEQPTPVKDAKTLRKEAKLRKLLDRKNRKKKVTEESADDEAEGKAKDAVEKAPISRLKTRLQAKVSRRQSTEAPRPTEEAAQVTEAATEQTTTEKATEHVALKEVNKVEEQSHEAAFTESDLKSVVHPAPDEESNATTEEEKKEKERGNGKPEAGGQKDEKVGEAKEEIAEPEGIREAPPTEVASRGPGKANSPEAVEASTIATTTTTATAAGTEEASRPDEATREELLQGPGSVLVIPEVDGLIFNPVVSISPDNFDLEAEEEEAGRLSEKAPEEMRSSSEETGHSADGDQTFDVNPYVREEVPPNTDEESYGGSESADVLLSDAPNLEEATNGDENRDVGTPDLIAQLLEGDEFQMWKEAEPEEEFDSEAEGDYYPPKKRSLTDGGISSGSQDVTEGPVGNASVKTLDPESEDSFGKSPTEYLSEPAEFGTAEESFTAQLKEAAGEEAYVAADAGDSSGAEAVPTETLGVDVEGSRNDEEKIAPAKGELAETEGREQSVTSDPPALRRRRRGIVDRRMLTPEERIRNFKRLVHRRHSPYSLRNEIPVSNERDSFWKVAGSTVKAVFNDVIPEAYGKTKDKIENLGIAEYFKEFGKIVEQMKNLDRLFANIGQAAVKNYIKGSEDEKGDYIQVIGKKRRSRRDAGELLAVEETATDAPGETVNFDTAPSDTTEATTSVSETTEATVPSAQVYLVHNEVTTPNVRPRVEPPGRVKVKGLKKYVKERPHDLIRDIFLMDSNPGIVEVTKSPPTTEPTSTIALQPFEPRYSTVPKLSYFNNGLFKRNSLNNAMRDGNRLFIDKMMLEREIQRPEMQKFSPWMRTTKEFINQALNTLQRQRELSEMIARESVNDLVKREIERKVIRKRDASEDRVVSNFFPVYQMPSNRKREIYGSSKEDASRYLRQLQPGVYIVPTEDMKNLRSEQIMKEAPDNKPGTPNMVTLNIYYDKKKSSEWEESREELEPAKASADVMRFYEAQGIPWSPVPVMNHPAPDYMPSVPESTGDSRYLPSLQGIPPFQTDNRLHEPLNPRIIHYPEPYTDWMAPSQRGYPVLPRNQQTFYYPSDPQFGQPKSDWTDFKTHPAPVPDAIPFSNSPGTDSGWAVQFQPTKKKSLRAREPLRPADRQLRPFPDKKRSVGSGKMDPNFSGLALPFWKFFMPKKDGKAPETDKAVKRDSNESDSVEELFAENRKRAKQNAGKQNGAKQKEEEPKETAPDKSESAEAEPDMGSRRKRDLSRYVLEFHDHQLLPEYLGTVQDLDNALHEEHDQLERLARIASMPWAERELLLREGIDGLRSRRSVAENVEILQPLADVGRSPVDQTKPVLTKLNSEDSSLEVPSEAKAANNATESGSTDDGNTEDPLTHFFKYAYDSLIHVMKGMASFV